MGEGEWAAAKHGGPGTRGWKKLHLGVNGAGIIVVQSLTEATVDDASVGADLIGAAVGDVAASPRMRPTTRSPSMTPRGCDTRK